MAAGCSPRSVGLSAGRCGGSRGGIWPRTHREVEQQRPEEDRLQEHNARRPDPLRGQRAISSARGPEGGHPSGGGGARRWDREDPALLSPCSAGSDKRAACRGTRPACSTPGSTARPHATRDPPAPRRAHRPGSSHSPPGTGGTPSERHPQAALRMERDGGDWGVPKHRPVRPAGLWGGSGGRTARTCPAAEPVEARLAATRVLPQHEAAVLLRDALRGGGTAALRGRPALRS